MSGSIITADGKAYGPGKGVEVPDDLAMHIDMNRPPSELVKADTAEDLDTQAKALQSQIEALRVRRDALVPAPQPPPADLPLDDAAISQKLIGAGLDTPDKVKAATDDALRAIPGIGEASVAKIRAQMSA